MDIGIVGAGIIGLSAAESATRLGADVTVFDRSEPGAGQSGGFTRIFRHLHTDEIQVGWAVEARESWRHLEQRSNQELVGDEGVLFHTKQATEQQRKLVAAGVRAEILDADHAREALPILGPDASGEFVFDLDGGAIRVDKAISALQTLMRGDAVRREEVFGIRQESSYAEITTAQGIYRFDKVLVTAGTETLRFARSVAIDFEDMRGVHPRLTFEAPESLSDLPCFVDQVGPLGEAAYAGPIASTNRYVVGLSRSEMLPLGRREHMLDQDQDLSALLQRTVAYVNAALPGLRPNAVDMRICEVTRLLTGSDAFATWTNGRITVFAGHNVMKFAPLIGEWIADAAVNDHEHPELTKYRA